MSEPTDWDDLAKRYLDLWQEQLALLGADQQLSDQFARLAQDMTALAALNPMAGFAAALPGSAAPGGEMAAGDDGGPAGTAAAGAAPGQRDERLDELERRVAAMEARLDRMARAAGGDG